MNFEGKRILILEGYARQNLEYMRAFKKLGCHVTVLCNSKRDMCYVSRLPDRRLVGPCSEERMAESEAYIKKLIMSGDYDLVLPAVDFSARVLSDNYEELSKYAHLATVTEDKFDIASDKLSVMKICTENGIPCPKTYFDLQNEQPEFPLAVKPRKGFGGEGFRKIETKSELDEFKAKEDISGYVVQNYIVQTNRNYTVCLFIDNSGDVKSSFTYASRRWFPIPAGSGTFNELVKRDDLTAIATKLAKIIGLTGFAGIDIIENSESGEAMVLEINPRPVACVKIGFEAGVNLALQTLQKEFGLDVDNLKTSDKPLFVRNSVNDIAWFVMCKERFSAAPSYFMRRNTKEQVFRIDDPLPWFAYVMQGIRYLTKK